MIKQQSYQRPAHLAQFDPAQVYARPQASNSSTTRHSRPPVSNGGTNRARSQNNYNSSAQGTGKKFLNKSQQAWAQQQQQRSASINKQLQYMNNTSSIQNPLGTLMEENGPQLSPLDQFMSLNNSSTPHQQKQIQAIIQANHQMLKQSSSLEDGNSYNLQAASNKFQNFLSNQYPMIQTPTTISSLNQRRPKHMKAYSMVQSTRAGAHHHGHQNSIPLVNTSQRQLDLTEQYLNQPLQLNQRILNQTIQYGGNLNTSGGGHITAHGFTQMTPLNFQTITPIANSNQNDNEFLSNYFSQQVTAKNKQANNFNMSGVVGGQHLIYTGGRGYSPSSINHFNLTQNQNLNSNNQPNLNFTYNTATAQAQMLYKQPGISQSSSRISAAKLKNNLNNTVSHIRSYSNHSKKEFPQSSSVRTGLGQNQSQTIQHIVNNSSSVNQNINLLASKANAGIPESQLLESEEYFEQGKVFLGDKKYKEAIKAFSKSLQNNKANFDALFYRGVTHLDSNQPLKAITDLTELIDTCPDYRKTMFIVLSIAFRRTNDYTAALRTLSKAIFKYPKYLEAYIARGQIYIFQKKWDKALQDFRIVIQLQPENGLGYLGQGDSLKGIGNYNSALISYTKATEVDPQSMSQGLMKRGILYLQMKYSEQALVDFNKLCELAEQEEPQSAPAISKAYFYKAKTLKKMENFNDAILHFEQVIRLSDDQYLQSCALYEIAKIKIQQKDFYEAYYNLQRATHYKLKQKKLINYKIFTEGVIFLMKRKTKTGVKLLTGLIEKLSQSSQQTQTDYITPLIYIYRAYGYFVTDDFDKSLKDYIKSNQLMKLNTSAYYNMIMCQGLKSLEKKEFENAISFFTKGGQKIPGNRDPYFLRAVSIVQYALHKPIKPQTRNKMLRDAKRDLNRALKHSPKDYQVMYFRGVLNFALHYFFDAITDFETVIEKSEETHAKFYLARGRCYACLSMFKEAITDLSIAINLNKDLLDAYLNRGKCAYLVGDTALAFIDFQKLIVLEPKNLMVHIYAGNLLMTTGSYDDATKAFTNADNIHKSPLALYQRSRCHVALNSMNEALKDLNKVIEISPNDKVAIADRDCLNALKSASTSLQQTNLQLHDKSVYEKSANVLTKLISYEKNQHLAKINHDSSIMHHHSQIIPSAQRTKTDKIRAIRRRREQDREVQHQLRQGGENSLRKNDLRFRVANSGEEEGDDYDEISEIDEKELQRLDRQKRLEEMELGLMETETGEGKVENDDKMGLLNTDKKRGSGVKDKTMSNKEKLLAELAAVEEEKEEETNYYKENIFNKEDYYLYRAVLFFYCGEHEKSIQDFEQSSSIMHANKVLYPKNQFSDDIEDQDEDGQNADAQSNGSSQTDLSDVGLCSLNIHEYSFNTILNLLQLKEYKKALTKLDYMIDTIPKKYAHQIWLIRHVLNQILGYGSASKKDLKRAYKYDKENTAKFIDQKQSVTLNVFPQQSRLCNYFSYVKFQFQGFQGSLMMKPSFSFPFIKPPNMIPCVDNSVLEEFTSKAIPLKPEAPWIKKCSFGIKFTEEIYFTDDDREATPDEEKEYKKRKQQQQQRARAAAFIKSYSEKVILKNKIFINNGNPPNQETQMKPPSKQGQMRVIDLDGGNGAADVYEYDQKHMQDFEGEYEEEQKDFEDIEQLEGSQIMFSGARGYKGSTNYREQLGLPIGFEEDDLENDDPYVEEEERLERKNQKYRMQIEELKNSIRTHAQKQ